LFSDTSIKELKRSGRPRSTYSLTPEGRKISDEQIKEYLTELVCGEGFPYGYRKLTVCLREDYGLIINHKKVYRLCKELDIFLPQRKVKRAKPRVLARREEVTGPNQLWEMDLKYGYIPGTDQFSSSYPYWMSLTVW
jgi:putative transposase